LIANLLINTDYYKIHEDGDQLSNLSSRAKNIDFMRGILIVIVVWGHMSTQLKGGATLVDYNPLQYYGTIFLMPLFMAISGYFGYSSLTHKDIMAFVKKKALRLLLPCIVWSFILLFFRFAAGFIFIKPLEINFEVMINRLNQFWYLGSAFVCSITFALTNHIVKTMHNRIVGYIITTILFCLLPSNFWYIAFMYPFYFCGAIFHKYENIFLKIKWIPLLSGICFIIMIPFYKFKHSIYEAEAAIWSNNGVKVQMGNNIWRWVIGFVGCICVSYLLSFIYFKMRKGNKIKEIFEYLGLVSMELYVIHIVIVVEVFGRLIAKLTANGFSLFVQNSIMKNYIYAPILSAIFIYICLVIRKVLIQVPFCSRLLFGTEIIKVSQLDEDNKTGFSDKA
jgi:fucose 4-O-acetylase-like acetyltransferase